MEHHPMLGQRRGHDDEDHTVDLSYDVESAYDTGWATLTPAGVCRRALASTWRLKRRRPIFIATLWGLILVSTALTGLLWVYRLMTGSISPVPDYSQYNMASVDNWVEVDEGIAVKGDSTHVLVPYPSTAESSLELLPPMDTRPPLDVLVHYYQTGELPNAINFPQPSLDIVYLFVNGSSPYFAEAYDSKLKSSGTHMPPGKGRHWRDNGELRGAMRSGALSLAGRLARIHVVSAAFDWDNKGNSPSIGDDDGTTTWRMGQIPSWLNWTNKSNVQWHFHPNIWRLPRDNGTLPPSIADIDEDEWRSRALPSFNSFEIECRLPWVSDLAEEFIHSNDDMFLMRELSRSDFHHPLFGTVFRLEASTTVKPHVTSAQQTDSGEWGGLSYAAQLLSQRFPLRIRAYMQHVPKALRRSLVHELSIMFASQLTDAATRPFRESPIGVADVEMAWLATHLQIERWREALLWTWAVAKVGDADNNWGAQARDELREMFGLTKGQEKGRKPKIDVTKNDRTTTSEFGVNSLKGGWEMPAASKILYTSLDGHMDTCPYNDEEWAKFKKLKGRPTSKSKLRPAPPTECTFDVDACLPANFWDDDAEFSADEMFKSLAFKRYKCGDCIIDALVTASGTNSLKAFLPPADKMYTPSPDREPQLWDRPEPILPLTDTWEAADFTLANNVRLGQDEWTRVFPKEEWNEGQVSLLDWSVKLLSRYAYVYANTPASFNMVTTPVSMRRAIRTLTDKTDLALACVNDDQPDSPATDSVRSQFQRWMQSAFGRDSPFVQWEKPNVPWDTEFKGL